MMRTSIAPTRPAKIILSARQGVAAVEFALLAPVLVLLFGGAVSFGDALRVKVELGNAARAGADYAAIHGGSNTANIQAAAQAATSLGVNVTVLPVLSSAECMSSDGSAPVLDPLLTTCPSNTSTGAPPGIYLSVTVSVPYHYIIAVPGITNTATVALNSVATARVQ